MMLTTVPALLDAIRLPSPGRVPDLSAQQQTARKPRTKRRRLKGNTVACDGPNRRQACVLGIRVWNRQAHMYPAILLPQSPKSQSYP